MKHRGWLEVVVLVVAIAVGSRYAVHVNAQPASTPTTPSLTKKPANPITPIHLTYSPLSIYGVRLGMTKDDLVKLLGRPAEFRKSRDGTVHVLTFGPDDVQDPLGVRVLLSLEDDKVVFVQACRRLEQDGHEITFPGKADDAQKALPGGKKVRKEGDNPLKLVTSLYWPEYHLRVDCLFTVDAYWCMYALGDEPLVSKVPEL
jgi:hypothetical protein